MIETIYLLAFLVVCFFSLWRIESAKRKTLNNDLRVYNMQKLIDRQNAKQ